MDKIDNIQYFVNILVVDDDPDILNLLKTILEGEGYGVETASSGEEALDKLSSYLPEVIISDVQMPGMSGYELCRRIREMGHDTIPFFFCTVLGSRPERILGLRMGADEHLTKPVDPEELLLRVNKHIKKLRRVQAMMEVVEERESVGIMTGNIKEVSIPELLQLIDYLNVEEVCLHVKTPSGEKGRIFLAQKLVVHAETDDLSGQKAFFRMMDWAAGTFKVENHIFLDEPTMNDRLGNILMQGITQLDECQVLLEKVTERGREFLVVESSVDAAEIDEEGRDILDLVRKHRTIDHIIAVSHQDEVTTLQILHKLLKNGFIRTFSSE